MLNYFLFQKMLFFSSKSGIPEISSLKFSLSQENIFGFVFVFDKSLAWEPR